MSRTAGASPVAGLAALAAVLVVAGASPTAPGQPLAVASTKTELVQAHVVFRHGARTPTESYPGDPYFNDTYAPWGLGYLTNNGRRGMFHVGHLLRSRYVGAGRLLHAEYTPGVLLARTSRIERTQESAAAVLAGMFPPASAQAWPAEDTALGSLWMPIPYDVLPFSEDRAIVGSAPCAARDLEMARVTSSPEYQARLLDLLGADKQRYIEQHTSEECGSDATCIMNVYSALRSQEDLNMTLPDWSRQVYPEPLRSAANLWLESFSYTPLLRRLSFGDLPSWVLASASDYKQAARLHLYSGHDATVVAATNIFHLEPLSEAGRGIPEYGAHLLFEVHRDEEGALSLQFFYRRAVNGPLVRMVPRGCTAVCPLDTLRTLIADELPNDEESCDVPADRLMGEVLVNRHLEHALGR